MKSKLEKQKEAEQRAKIRSKRSHKDQLDHLDAIFGKDQGAAKERAKLKALIEKPVKSEEDRPKKEKRKKAKAS